MSSEVTAKLKLYAHPIHLPDASAIRTTCSLHESVLLTSSQVGIYLDKQRMYSHDQGILALTTHRIIWLPTGADDPKLESFGCELPLLSIQDVQVQKARLRSSPKLLCLLFPLPACFTLPSWTCATCQHTNPMTRTYPCTCAQCGMTFRLCPQCHAANVGSQTDTCHLCKSSLHFFTCPQCTLNFTPSASAYCSLCQHALPVSVSLDFSFRGTNNIDQFFNELKSQMKKNEAQRMTSNTANSPNTSGVHGLVQKQQQLNEVQQQNLETAFTDLNALMRKAKEMVDLANTLVTKLQDAPADAVTQFRGSMLQLGLTLFDPIVESTLVHELTQFLRIVLPSEGMLSLVDVYCMFNRAKGTALISPQDLWSASQQLQPPFYALQFHSGARVIHTEEFSASHLHAKFKGMTAPYLEAASVSKEMHVPLSLSTQLLEEAVFQGVLVIDQLSQRYYPNRFLEPF